MYNTYELFTYFTAHLDRDVLYEIPGDVISYFHAPVFVSKGTVVCLHFVQKPCQNAESYPVGV